VSESAKFDEVLVDFTNSFVYARNQRFGKALFAADKNSYFSHIFNFLSIFAKCVKKHFGVSNFDDASFSSSRFQKKIQKTLHVVVRNVNWFRHLPNTYLHQYHCEQKFLDDRFCGLLCYNHFIEWLASIIAVQIANQLEERP